MIFLSRVFVLVLLLSPPPPQPCLGIHFVDQGGLELTQIRPPLPDFVLSRFLIFSYRAQKCNFRDLLWVTE